MLTDIRLSKPLPDTRWCCVARCNEYSATILGEYSVLPQYYDLRQPVGICGEHWDMYCNEVKKPKAAARAVMKSGARKRVAVAIDRAPKMIVEEFEEEEEEEEEEQEASPRKQRKIRLRIRRR